MKLWWQDVWRSLTGRQPDRVRYQKLITECRAQWLDLLVEIESTLEKLQAVDTRLRKRIEHAEKAGVAATGPRKPSPEETLEQLPPKERARLKARMRGLIGPAHGQGAGAGDNQGEMFG